jgi:hypothetical protein
MATARATASNLRQQGTVVRWTVPTAAAVIAAAAGVQVSSTTAIVATSLAVPVGLLLGFWSAAWFDAAADALDCGTAILDAINRQTNVSAQLSVQLAGHQAQTIEALRMLGEHMVERSTTATELLRVVAENTEALTRRAG